MPTYACAVRAKVALTASVSGSGKQVEEGSDAKSALLHMILSVSILPFVAISPYRCAARWILPAERVMALRRMLYIRPPLRASSSVWF